MATLNGTQINNTYKGLVKLTDNNVVSSNYKELTDGLGNGLGLYVRTDGSLQLNGDLAVTGEITADGGNIISFYFADQSSFPSATTYHGAIAHSHADGKMYFAHGGSWVELALASDITTALTTEEVQDIVGAMFTNNTETNITATYEDVDGTIDLVANAYTGGADYGIEIVSDDVRLKNDRRRNADEDVHTGNSADYIHFDSDVGMSFYTNSLENARLTDAGELHVEGDVVAASTTISSDERLKENIEVISNSLEIIEQIKGVNFDWKKDGSKSSGIIAQDIQKVMPHLVKEVNDLGGGSHLTVNYDGLIGLLIEAVKELSNKLKE